MQIIKDFKELSSFPWNKEGLQKAGKSAVAIGKFDGIHIGHQALLQRIIDKKKEGMLAVVFTFSPSPEEFFKGEQLPAIDTQEEKRANFEALGVDILLEYPLTKESAAISPMDFMQKVLVELLHSGYVVSGKDLSFGDKGAGNSCMLASFALEHSFEYEVIDKVCIEQQEVSSTAVREAIKQGNMEKVCRMLGREYQICGEVVHGRALGRTIQLPTINLLPSPNKLLPPSGVYATITQLNGKEYMGVTNIGYKPTVSDAGIMGVETHLFDFAEDVYGKNAIVRLLHFIRPEMKFSGIAELSEQMKMDKASTQAFFAYHCKG